MTQKKDYSGKQGRAILLRRVVGHKSGNRLKLEAIDIAGQFHGMQIDRKCKKDLGMALKRQPRIERPET